MPFACSSRLAGHLDPLLCIMRHPLVLKRRPPAIEMGHWPVTASVRPVMQGHSANPDTESRNLPFHTALKVEHKPPWIKLLALIRVFCTREKLREPSIPEAAYQPQLPAD